MIMKPTTCQDEKCDGMAGTCEMCINRSAIAKKGYELCRIIENIPASLEQTAGIIAVQEFIRFAEKEYKSAERSTNSRCAAALAGALAECNVNEDWANRIIDAFNFRAGTGTRTGQ